MKHTPGPWTIDPATDGRSKGFIRCEKKIDGALRGIAVARVSEVGIGYSEAQANAALIAAAPELLAECEKQVVWLKHIQAQRDVPASVKLGIEQGIKYLNAVIQKATS